MIRKRMFEKKVKKRNLKDPRADRETLHYCLSKSPEERIAAVEYLRRQHNGCTGRLQGVAQVIRRTSR